MLKTLRRSIYILLFLTSTLAEAQDRGSSGGLFQRAAHRESKRWTLQEWLETKERNRMMDLWLALNSPSPYEGMLGVAYNGYKNTTSSPLSETTYTATAVQLSAYASILGLTADYSKNDQENFNDVTGLLNLRIFGNSIQSTYLTLHVGQRTRTLNQVTGDLILRQNLAQVSLQLYLNKFFGLDGIYRQYSEVSDPTLGLVKGQLNEAGIFLDFNAFRIFGTWTQDIQINSLSGTETRIERTGVKSGFKIFFEGPVLI